MNRREINAHARRAIRRAERNGMQTKVADAMRYQVEQENRRYRFALDYASGLASGRREFRANAHRRFCADVFAIADVAHSFSAAAMGRGGSKVRAN